MAANPLRWLASSSTINTLIEWFKRFILPAGGSNSYFTMSPSHSERILQYRTVLSVLSGRLIFTRQ